MRQFFGVLIFLILALPSIAEERPGDFLGLQFPQLKSDRAAWIVPSDTVFVTAFPIDFEVQLFISESGGVDSIDYNTNIKPDFIRGVKNSLRLLEFEPAEIWGKTASLILPIRITFNSVGASRRVDLILPFDAATGARERRLIDRTLMENGFTLPGLDYFPSYYMSIPKDSGRVEYDYSVYRVNVDSAGNVIEFAEQSTSNTKLSEIFSITARYARFRSAGYRDSSFSAGFYLIARFFDETRYPVAAWPADSLSPRSHYTDQYRLESVLYLDSLLSPAYPENLSESYGFSGVSIDGDSIPVEANITAAGAIELPIFEKYLSEESRQNLIKILKRVRLIPALDSTGKAVPFHGKFMISRMGSNKLRITENWLN